MSVQPGLILNTCIDINLESYSVKLIHDVISRKRYTSAWSLC